MTVDPAAALPSRPSPGAAGARLAELYEAHARMVYGICRMLLRDADEAEDATQQVFLSAYGSLLTGTRVRDPAAWLGTIARNDCRRRAKRRLRERYTAGDEVTLVSPAADDAAIGRENAAALYAQLAVLPDKQREAVVLRDLFGLRYDEVAKALGTSRPAVEALLFRGRRRLKGRLRPDLVAGVLVVPVALRDSIAYAVPGFAATGASEGALVAAAGIPLALKLAAGGGALAIAGSASFVAERSPHDRPSRPPSALAAVGSKPGETSQPPPPAGGFPLLRMTDNAGARPTPAAVALEDDEDRDERGHVDDDRSGPEVGDERQERDRYDQHDGDDRSASRGAETEDDGSDPGGRPEDEPAGPEDASEPIEVDEPEPLESAGARSNEDD